MQPLAGEAMVVAACTAGHDGANSRSLDGYLRRAV